MARCTVCDYFFQPDTNGEGGDRANCPVCRVRTTSAQRAALLRGHRLDYSYMDSD